MKNSIVTGARGLLLVVSMMLFFSGSVMAASACKGLSKSRCNTNNSCSWVEKYTTKKGTSVGPFCRSKPGKASPSRSAVSNKSKSGKTVEARKKTVSQKKTANKEKKSAAAKKKKAKKKTATKKKAAQGKVKAKKEKK